MRASADKPDLDRRTPKDEDRRTIVKVYAGKDGDEKAEEPKKAAPAKKAPAAKKEAKSEEGAE